MSQKKPRVFVVMCFDQRLQEIYHMVVQPVLEERHIECVRADEICKLGVVVEQIRDEIANADLVLCDLTFENPNVFYELGIAHAANKKTVLISQTVSAIPFDVSHYRVIPYADTKQGLLNLRLQLVKALAEVSPGQASHQPSENGAATQEFAIEEIEIQRSALYTTNPEFIRYAVRYLGQVKDELSYGRIEQIAQTNYSPADLVRDALTALRSIDDSRALAAILESAKYHSHYLVREHAVKLLGIYPQDTDLGTILSRDEPFSLLEAVQQLLRDGSWGVRQSVCQVLGRWGDPRATASLLGAQADSEPPVVSAAQDALRNLRNHYHKDSNKARQQAKSSKKAGDSENLSVSVAHS